MRLKKIKLAGFKSFVDPTTVVLPGQMAGIVGPNGCGKSNIIDAVRWVMGESSAKHLRGDSMADVIFNGSNSRKPVGHASVELVFDNSEGALGGQYAAYAEIAVKRQVSRDGQSVYFLNGTRCRRRDITDIFLGTGLGPRSYAIIEQGTISRLIEAKPDELRLFLEEAAGISKYKERRRETETRMRHTHENLNRLNDLRDELDKRLQSLQRQAKTAEKFKELKQQERLLKAQLQALRWRVLNDETVNRDQAIRALETRLEGELAQLRHNEAAIEQSRSAHIEQTDAFNRVQADSYRTGAEIARLEQAIQHAKETREQQQRGLRDAEKAWEEVNAHLETDRAAIELVTAELADNEHALEEAREREQRSSMALKEAEEATHAWQHAWDEFNARAAAQLQAAEVERARITHLEQRMIQVEERRARFQTELNGIAPQGLEAELEAIETRKAELDENIETLQREQETSLTHLAEERRRHQALGNELHAARTALQNAEGRRASLSALQEEALGKGRAATHSWLQNNGLAQRQRLAQALTVEQGWERAVETVLGFALEAVCVEGFESVAQAIGQIKKGEVELFDTSAPPLSAARGTAASPLLDKVTAPWPLDSLLAGVYAAPTLDEALALRARLEARESVITRDGVWLGYDWLRVARGTDEQSSVLLREQSLKTLRAEIEELKEKIDILQQQAEECAATVRDREQAREAAQARLRELTQRRAEVHAQKSGREERLAQMRLRAERLRAELTTLATDTERDTQEMREARQRLEEALLATENHVENRESLLRERDEHRAAWEKIRDQARADREGMHAVALRVEAQRMRLRTTRESLERMQRQLQHLSSQREELQRALAVGGSPIETMKQELEAQLAQRLHVDAQLAQARRAVEEVDHHMREFTTARALAEERVQTARQELDSARLACQEIRVRRETLQEQIAASNFTLDQLLEQLPPEAAEETWHEDVERITQQIQRLGAINLAAIDEYAQESERKAYLDAQHADLTEALTTLENAIRKIDRETKERFQETFDKVNTGLQAMFPRLFGGGQAYLELTGEDLLETGVTVMARPPGKRNSTIHLLSGGEKALTAVAMVFAIFELNPAPFCMLDEVDAPLDDANVGRFSNMVKEMSSRVQFIFITHNKGTMEAADQLIGVTMHEPGVSRLVAVDIDEAMQWAAAG